MNTASETSLSIDWDAIDMALNQNIMPEGAITRQMVQERYGCGKTCALDKISALEKLGWSVGYMNCPTGGKVKYVYKEG